jgi:glycoside/pentoside/hexuronide:cation symporter, GPH family
LSSQKLPLKTKLGYGVCDLGGNLFFTVIAFLFLNYLTDTVGISAGLAGGIIMVGKIWDAVTDPVAGYLSDNTRSRWGRRRPYMFFGSIPLFFTMILMFTNPRLDGQGALFAWGVVSFCLLCAAYTVVNIPYSALTPELTQDFHERTSLNGYRFGFAVIGTLIGAGAALPLVNAFPDKNTGFTVLGTLFGFIMMITAMTTVFTVQEPPRQESGPARGFFKTYLGVFGNRPYVLILLTYALHVTALTVVSGIAIYYFKYVHHNEAMTTAAMVALLVTAMVFIPVSVVASKKIGKKAAYGFGMGVFSAAIMVLFFFGHLRPPSFSIILMVFAGVGMGFTYALPYAMVPDAIEYDYLRTGKRTEGAFYGIWTFSLKIGQALALGITGSVLSLTGYIPDVAQSASALFGIRLLLGPISAAIFMLAMAMLYFYPINEARYNEIMEGIRKMEAKTH